MAARADADRTGCISVCRPTTDGRCRVVNRSACSDALQHVQAGRDPVLPPLSPLSAAIVLPLSAAALPTLPGVAPVERPRQRQSTARAGAARMYPQLGDTAICSQPNSTTMLVRGLVLNSVHAEPYSSTVVCVWSTQLQPSCFVPAASKPICSPSRNKLVRLRSTPGATSPKVNTHAASWSEIPASASPSS